MLPELNVLLMALVCGGLGFAVVLLVSGLRRVSPDPARPPGRLGAAAARLRDPALSLRLGAAALVVVTVLVLTRWPAAALGLGALVGFWPLLFGGAARRAAADRAARGAGHLDRVAA